MYEPFPGGSQASEPAAPAAAAPPSIIRAVQVMYAGAVASLIGIAVNATTYSSLETALARRRGKNGKLLTHAQIVDLAHVELIVLIVAGLIAAAVWVWLARSCGAGKSWARTVSTVLFAINTIGVFVAIGGGALAESGATRIYGFVVWIIGLIAIVLLWQRASSDYFKAGPLSPR
jgi:hypothetical protein